MLSLSIIKIMKLTHENAGFLKITLLFDPNGQTGHIDTKKYGSF